MKAVLAVIPIVALVIIGIVVGAFVFKTRDTLRYRMTVEIDAPDGPVAGTSVIESTIGKRLPWADSGVFFELRGEAVLVRLRDGRVVFALLRSNARYDPPGYHAALVPEAMRSLAEYRRERHWPRPMPFVRSYRDSWKRVAPLSQQKTKAAQLNAGDGQHSSAVYRSCRFDWS